MLSTLTVILPIFAVILAGFICRRTGILGPTASSELNRFVVWLGLPALLFGITAHASWSELYQPGLAVSFGLGCFVVFAITIAVRIRRNGLAEASIDGLNAAYANTGYIGFPLCLLVFGTEGFTGVAIASIITACVLFGVAIVLLEIGIQTDRRPGPMLLNAFTSVAKNPLLIAPVAGVAFAASGLPMPTSVDTFIKLLSAAASPCALVALGTFLAERRPAADPRATAFLTVMKLLVQPGLTYVFAVHVFALPKHTADLAILIAALPTGTGPFMLAEYYWREAGLTANVILWSTLGSIATLSLFLHVSGYGRMAP